MQSRTKDRTTGHYALQLAPQAFVQGHLVTMDHPHHYQHGGLEHGYS